VHFCTVSKWYNIDTSGAVPEISLFEQIGGFGISDSIFLNEVKNLNSKKINLVINSPGGDVFKGISIYHGLKDNYDVNVKINGIAASISSVIALAGNDLPEISEGSAMLIHEATTGLEGRASDMLQAASDLEKINDAIAQIYSVRTGKTKATIRKVMAEGSLLSAQESISLGLARKSKTGAKNETAITNEYLNKNGFTKTLEQYNDLSIKNLLIENNESDIMATFKALAASLEKKWNDFTEQFKKENKNEAPKIFNLTPEEKAKIDEAVKILSDLEGAAADAPKPAPKEGEAAADASLLDIFKNVIAVNKTQAAKIKEQELEIGKMSAPGYKTPDPEEEKNERMKATRTEINASTTNAVKDAIKSKKR